MKKVIFLPFFGEFGWLVMSHLRYVHWVSAEEKIVCCEPGQKCLFPSATEFFTDYRNPLEDSDRCGFSSYHKLELVARADENLRSRLSELFPGFEIHRPTQYDCPWHTSDFVRPKLAASHALPRVDVALGVRRRDFAAAKNWRHWQHVADVVRAHNLTVGLVGGKSTSFDFPADARSWLHPEGETAGSIDMLNHCGLYVGTDTGVSHLAALLSAPMLVFRKAGPGNDDWRGVMDRANKNYFQQLADDAWDRPDEVLGAIFRCRAALCSGERPRRGSLFWSQHGEDRWIKENLSLPSSGCFCEVGAHDGVSCSTTMHYELEGWSGVVVEPDPRQVNLKNNRQRSKVFTCAAGRESGEAVFHLMDHAPLSGILRSDGTAIDVEVKTLTQILDETAVKGLDLLTIDTEGTELDVWAGLDVERFRPQVVMVEYDTAGLPCRRDQVRRAISADGYQEVNDIGGNLIFIRRDSQSSAALSPRIAVVVHLYYLDLWEEIFTTICNLDGQTFRLFVSLPADNPDSNAMRIRILAIYPRARVDLLPNQGMDIVPFLHFLREIVKDDYRYVLKLHGKKCLLSAPSWDRDLGERWRRSLFSGLCGSPNIVSQCMNALSDEQIGMIGSNGWILQEEHRNGEPIQSLRAALGVEGGSTFVAGTMFWAKMDIFRQYFNSRAFETIDPLLAATPSGYVSDASSGTYLHGMERLFGYMIEASGKSIIGV